MKLNLSINERNVLIRDTVAYSFFINRYTENLFSFTKISTFQYVRFTRDNFWQGVSTHQKSIERNIEREYFIARFSEYDFAQLRDGVFFLKDTDMNEVERIQFNELSEAYNIGNVFIITKKTDSYCDFFCFGADNNLNLSNFYLNNMEMLKKICGILQSRIRADLDDKPNMKVAIPQNHLLRRNPFFVADDQDMINVFHSYFINKVGEIKYRNIMQLNKQKKKCFIKMLYCLNSKKIADFLKISHRTVESHIESIKHKFFVTTKKEILRFFDIHTL